MSTTCKNCETVLTGKFCVNCGQNSEIHPITTSTVLHDFFHAFTHTDKGFLLTIKHLLRYPGIVAKEYLAGRRKKYFNPLSFLVITMAISAYLAYESGYFKSFAPSRQSPTSNQTVQENAPKFDPEKLGKSARVRYEANMIIVKHGKIIGLVLITPLIAFLSWVFFRKPKYNFAEHFVLSSYLFGLANVFRVIIFIPLFMLLPSKIQMIDGLFQVVFLVYLIVTFRQFFRQNIFLTIVKTVFVFALFIFLFWFLIWGYAYLKHIATGTLA